NIHYSLNDIGKVYQSRKDYQTAIKYHQQAFDISQKLNAKVDMGQSLLNLGDTYMSQGNTSEAIDYYKRSEVILKEISNANYDLEKAYKGLGYANSSIDEFRNAFRSATLCT